jgi:tetratricopeptide (TPR) repeat protein
MSSNFFIARDHRRAIDAADRGLAAVDGLDDFRVETELNFRLAQIHQALSNYPRAIELTRRNIEVLTGDRTYRAFTGPNLTAVLSRAYLARWLAELGQFGEAIALAEESVRIAEVKEYLNSFVVALCTLGVLHLRSGDLAAAIAVLERDVQLCQAAEILTVYAWATPCLGLAYALSGRRSEARPILDQAVEHGARGTGDLAWQIGIAGEGYLRVGDIENATRLANRSLRLSRDASERGYEAWALRLLGEIASGRDPAELVLAERCYHQALAAADELGMRPLAAHCHLGLSTLYRRTGDGARAREQLTTATTMYRDMQMPFWLEQAKAMASSEA